MTPQLTAFGGPKPTLNGSTRLMGSQMSEQPGEAALNGVVLQVARELAGIGDAVGLAIAGLWVPC